MQLEDINGNTTIASNAQTIILGTTSTAGAFYATKTSKSPITSIVIPAGQSSVNVYYDDTNVGMPTVTAADSALSSAPTQVETIVVAAAHSLRLTGYPLTTTAGVSHTFTVTVLDAYGNVDTNYTGTVEFSSSDLQAVAGSGLPVDYTFTRAPPATTACTPSRPRSRPLRRSRSSSPTP